MKCRNCGAENTSNMTICGNCASALDMAPVSESGRREHSDTIEGLLSKDALRIESVYEKLLKMKGSFLMRSLSLPMAIVFRSEVETASLNVDEDGKVSISKGELPKPRMLVEGDHLTICSVLRSREPRISAPGAVELTVNYGPLRGTKVRIADGQIMDHPFKDLCGYGFADSQAQGTLKPAELGPNTLSSPVRRSLLVLLTALWAIFAALTIFLFIAGFEGSRILNVIDFAFALIITVLLSALLLMMLAFNAFWRSLADNRL